MPARPRPEPAASDPGVPIAADDRPSKTRLKQASHDLQALGEAVADLPEAQVDALDIPETLRDAIREAGRIRSHEGRRRHFQYIGKLMRRVDPEPMRRAVADAQLGRARDALALHEAERWRAELIADDAAATRWAERHAGADLQALRSLVRNARKDAALAPEQRSGRAYRELFRYVRRHASGAADADDTSHSGDPNDE